MSSFSLCAWWGKFWNLKIPPKVKIFIWKVIQNYIPTELNLAKHHIPTQGMCFLCKFHLDSTCHSFFFCDVPIWKTSSFWPFINPFRDSAFLDIFYNMSQSISKEDLCLFCVLAWAVWGEICKRKHDLSLLAKPLNVQWVHSLISEFNIARSSIIIQSPNLSSVQNSGWVAPLVGYLCMDVDAGVDDVKGCFSTEAIVYDASGNILAVSAVPIRNPSSVVKGELGHYQWRTRLCISKKISMFGFSKTL